MPHKSPLMPHNAVLCLVMHICIIIIGPCQVSYHAFCLIMLLCLIMLSTVLVCSTETSHAENLAIFWQGLYLSTKAWEWVYPPKPPAVGVKQDCCK